MKNILLDSNIIIQFKIFENSKLSEGVELSNSNIYITDVSLLELKSKMQFKDLKSLCYMIKQYDVYLITLSREKLKIKNCRFIYNRIKNFSNLKEYNSLIIFYEFYKKNFHNLNKKIKEIINEESEIFKEIKQLNNKIKNNNREHINFIKEYSKDNQSVKKILFSDFKTIEPLETNSYTDKFKSKNRFNINELTKESEYFNELTKDIYNNKIKDDIDYYYRIIEIVCNLDRKRILLDFKKNYRNMANDTFILSYSLFFKLNLISTDIKMTHRSVFFHFSSIGFFPIPILITNGKLKNIDKVDIFNI